MELAIVAAIGAVLAALGPFGSFAIGDYGARLAYWLPGSILGYAAFKPIFAIGIWTARRLDFPAPAGMIAGVLAAAVPASLLILWWNGRLGNIITPDRGFQLYVQVAIIGGIIAFLFTLIERATGRAPAASDGGGDPEEANVPFLNRLPADVAADLVALEMEDHYVRAHSPGRSTLILMRMRDAEVELGKTDGMRVHRSWWVARDAVQNVSRDGRRLVLELRGGLKAPVARDSVRALREAGWLD